VDLGAKSIQNAEDRQRGISAGEPAANKDTLGVIQTTMLRLRGVRKVFGSNVAVDGLDLEVRDGELFGLLGPNGAGKTTTVGMAVGLLKPDHGAVEIGDMGAPTRPASRRHIGVATQALALYEELSAEENVTFFGRIQGLRGRALSDGVDAALEFVRLSDRRKDAVRTYSGGMKRRLNLAVAMVHGPALMLLDEPTVGVDPQSRNAIFDNIQDLQRSGRTIVYTTHYMEEAEKLCDRVGIIDRGRLLALDTVPNLIAAHGGKTSVVAELEDREVRIETEDPVGELGRLQAAGKLLRFRVERPDLERVFLNLTGRHLRD
jgi:ABC-2 type transport system ATP-binding protein